MKKRMLLSSIMMIVLCISLISGATSALFTSESKTNIAISSGKVEIEAFVENLALYSMDKPFDQNFENGGTASYENGVLTIEKMSPGDKVEFEIKVTNSSNVDIQYRLNWKAEGELEEVLVAKANDKELENIAWTKWSKDAAEKEIVIKVSVELPVVISNEYQDKSCNIIFSVEAVQGNVTITDFDKIDSSEFVEN